MISSTRRQVLDILKAMDWKNYSDWKKSYADNKDPYFTLLAFRNTPIANNTYA